MTPFNYMLVIIWLIIVPCLIGYVVTRFSKIQLNSKLSLFLFIYAIGNVTMWALFQLLAVPLVLLKQKLYLLILMWCIGLVILFLLLMFCNRKKKILLLNKENIKYYSLTSKIIIALFVIVALAIIGYQCYKYVFWMHIDLDDSRFIVCAVDAYSDGNMYLTNPATGDYVGIWGGELIKDVASPWSMLLAALSKLTGVHPTVFAHTIYPPFLLIAGYCAFYHIGDAIFKGDTIKNFAFLTLVAFLNEYFSNTVYTQSRFALERIWQGKAVVAGVMIPLVTSILLLLYENTDGYLYALLCLSSLSMCLMSGMGIFFGGIMIGTFGIWYALIKRNIKEFLLTMCACVPTIIYGLVYLLVK